MRLVSVARETSSAGSGRIPVTFKRPDGSWTMRVRSSSVTTDIDVVKSYDPMCYVSQNNYTLSPSTHMHGLVYPPNLLNSLPILDTDIHSLDPETFAQLHLQHTLSHPPDNILFPFLHGLEGDNHAQNAFFATSNSAHPVQHRHHHYHSQELTSRITPKIPKYRGLVWVVCEEDLEQAGDIVSLRILRRKPVLLSCDKTGSSSSSSYSESDDDDEEEDDFDDEDEDLEMMSMSMDLDDRSSFTADEDDVVLASPIFNSQMQVDDVAVVAPDSLDHTSTVELNLDDVMKRKQEPHMHPIHHRAPHPPTTLSLPIPLPSILTQPQIHPPTPSSGSDDSNTSVSPVSIFESSLETEMESLSSLTPSECPAQLSSAQPPQPAQTQPTQSQTEDITDPYSPPLLTSTFRPKELLRRVRVEKPDGDTCSQQRRWEFVPAKVPDGISLRNFGIQVVSRFFPLGVSGLLFFPFGVSYFVLVAEAHVVAIMCRGVCDVTGVCGRTGPNVEQIFFSWECAYTRSLVFLFFGLFSWILLKTIYEN